MPYLQYLPYLRVIYFAQRPLIKDGVAYRLYSFFKRLLYHIRCGGVMCERDTQRLKKLRQVKGAVYIDLEPCRVFELFFKLA